MDKLLKLLSETKYATLIQNVEEITINGYKIPNLFKITTKDNRYFSFKIRSIDKYNITDSIEILKSIVNQSELLVGYNDVVLQGNNYILISEWIDGIQPISSDRENLPLYFKELALFNKSNICEGPFTSMYLDGKRFETIEEMISFEFNNHIQYYEGKHSHNYIKDQIKYLLNGIGCLIIEDMNTGNMIMNKLKNIIFIDMDYLSKGLNIYQFDHINLMKFNKSEWWNITAEAKNCLNSYFQTLGVSKNEAIKQIKSYYIFSILRNISYQKWNKCYINYDKVDENIEQIVSINKLEYFP